MSNTKYVFAANLEAKGWKVVKVKFDDGTVSPTYLMASGATITQALGTDTSSLMEAALDDLVEADAEIKDLTTRVKNYQSQLKTSNEIMTSKENLLDATFDALKKIMSQPRPKDETDYEWLMSLKDIAANALHKAGL